MHCNPVKVMASGHHVKPVTIIEMRQAHSEIFHCLPLLPPPLYPLYFALSFPPSYNCFLLDIQSCCHLFGLITLSSSPPFVFFLLCFFCLSYTAEDFSDGAKTETHSKQFLMHIPGLIVKDLSVIQTCAHHSTFKTNLS